MATIKIEVLDKDAGHEDLVLESQDAVNFLNKKMEADSWVYLNGVQMSSKLSLKDVEKVEYATVTEPATGG